jgi:hypothetical protein
MTEMARRQPASGRNPTLALISGILIAAGLVALFAPDLIRAFAPPNVADAWVDNALALLLVGFAIEGYQIVQLVQQLRVRAKRQQLSAFDRTGPAAPSVSTMNDPAAQQTDWTPLRRGGANFKTAMLTARGPNRLEVKVSGAMMLFCAAFIAMGLAIGGGIAVAAFRSAAPASAFVPAAFGLVFAAIGFGMLYFLARPTVFDRNLGWFWKGPVAARTERDFHKLKFAVPLNNIQALQLLAEHVSGSKSSYYSYELNLVLKDGRRINVMDHGNQDALRADADKLASFLGVPVWST